VDGLPPWRKELGNNTCEVDPGGSTWPSTNECPKNIGKVYPSVLELGFEHGDRG
jgi:hypothetical protein